MKGELFPSLPTLPLSVFLPVSSGAFFPRSLEPDPLSVPAGFPDRALSHEALPAADRKAGPLSLSLSPPARLFPTHGLAFSRK